MKPAIRVENLSKSYNLGTRMSGGYRTLRETINDSVAGVWHGLRRRFGSTGNGHAQDDDFWALKDVSFEVQPGEVVGVVGRNGAGKSTLLKVLSRIVEPTAGRCEVRGRMASLLEVGTGFHQELTGRENIYMNGSILGMSRKEITRKFDEIVEFAEIEQFLDTPVKRYSSGMYVRLAFAVAAHLEPEILIVDEVLAVGDIQFQRKCLGKIGEVSQQGRTVLLVSHNMAAIRSLCRMAILLKQGRLVMAGSTHEVTQQYLQEGLNESVSFNRNRHLASSRECQILDAWVESEGQRNNVIFSGESFRIIMLIDVTQNIRMSPEYLIRDGEQHPILFAPTGLYQGFEPLIEPGRYRIMATCPAIHLAAGNYFIDLLVARTCIRLYDLYECALRLEVKEKAHPPFGWRFKQQGGKGAIPLAVEMSINRDE